MSAAGQDVADTPDRAVILERNPFNLKRTATLAVNAAQPVLMPAPVRLVGLVSLGSKRWAYLETAKLNQPQRALKLAPGERAETLELLDIDWASQSIRVREGEFEWTINFEKESTALKTAERLFVREHIRAHELRQQQEREREELELKSAAGAGG